MKNTTLPQGINTMTLADMKKKMEDGLLTSRDLVAYYLDRIAEYNPKLKAVLEVNPEIEQLALVADAERSRGKIRGPLHGIPILVKDNIDTGDKMHTSAGSLALKDHYAAEDAFVVAQLRKSGALILGKANMTEWANFMSDHMPSGYSSRGGQVLNPYGPGQFDVGGSSAGSASGVAAGLGAAAIGSETSGSILNPASQNAVVGIKPTIGLVSRAGIIPIAHSQDTAGPIAQTVEDAAMLLEAIAGEDENDPITSLAETGTSYLSFLKKDGLNGARIGVPERFFEECTPEQMVLVELAIADMEEAGAVVLTDIDLPETKAEENIDVLVYEFKTALNAYLGKLPSHLPVHSLQDLLAFNSQNASEMLKYGQALLELSERTSGTSTDKEYINSRSQDVFEMKEKVLDQAFDEHHLDAILFPSSYGSPLGAKAGYPSICVPSGFTPDGEPLGLSFTGKAFSEGRLIEITYSYEQLTNHRRQPVLE